MSVVISLLYVCEIGVNSVLQHLFLSCHFDTSAALPSGKGHVYLLDSRLGSTQRCFECGGKEKSLYCEMSPGFSACSRQFNHRAI